VTLDINLIISEHYMNDRYVFGLVSVFILGIVGTLLVMQSSRVNVSAGVVAQAQSLPSSKAAASLGSLIDLGALASANGASMTDTGYVTVMQASIKTSEQKDLSADVAIQCGIDTDTTVRSKNATVDTATAKGAVSMRVKATHQASGAVRYFLPSENGTAPDGSPLGVTYCSRLQQLTAQFSGLNCTADLTTGVVTCADPEELGLILKTLSANSFNYLLPNASTGVWNIEVQARANSSASLGGSGLGSASANAFVGLGSTRIESLRLIKNADINPISI
jgi:hypothetical protein